MVIVMVCYLTKLIVLIPCLKTINAADKAKLIFQYWYCSGKGFPDVIVSDRDSKFTSKVWSNLCAEIGIQKAMSTSRHQQTDSLAENGVKMMKRILRKFAVESKEDWEQLLYLVEHALNSSASAVTGFTPYYLAFGYEPKEVLVREDIGENLLIRVLLNNLRRARNLIEEGQMDRVRKSKAKCGEGFQVGDLVMLLGEGINYLADYGLEKKKKFGSMWLGPFEINKWGDQADDQDGEKMDASDWTGVNYE
jgi:hypothetical protein